MARGRPLRFLFLCVGLISRPTWVSGGPEQSKAVALDGRRHFAFSRRWRLATVAATATAPQPTIICKAHDQKANRREQTSQQWPSSCHSTTSRRSRTSFLTDKSKRKQDQRVRVVCGFQSLGPVDLRLQPFVCLRFELHFAIFQTR